MANTAFLIIDVQFGMFCLPEMPHQAAELLERIATLAGRARSAGVPVIYLQHDGGEGHPLTKGTPGWQIHRSIAPASGDHVIEKRFSNSFKETALAETLESLGVRDLVIAGLQTEFCVGATCLAAASLNYDVTLVSDAHSTWRSEIVPAEQMIELCHARVREQGVHLLRADQIQF